MLNSLWIIIPMSAVLGFLSGLGTGGGSLLILWLTLALDMPQENARTINLLFFIPSALIACLFRWKQGKLRFRNILPAVISGCSAAATFSFLSTRMDVSMIRRLFGLLLLFTGVRELFYRPRKAK